MFHIINRRINRVVADIHKILLRNSLVQHVLDSHGIFGMPQLAGATFGPACSVDNSVSGDSSGSVFDWSVWFAAPKSKVIFALSTIEYNILRKIMYLYSNVN